MYHSFWHKVPFVRLLLPFVLGISTALFVPCDFTFAIAGCLVSFLAFAAAHRWLERPRYATWSGIALSLCFYFSGIALNVFQDELFSNAHFSKQAEAQYFLVNIDEPAVEKARSFKLHAKVIAYVDALHAQHACNGNLMIYAAKDSTGKQLRYGDVLLISSKQVREVPPPQNPDEFDYKRYLRFHHIHYQAYIRQGAYVKAVAQQSNALFSWVYDVQRYFRQVLATNIASASETGVAQALLYGYDDEIDPDVMQAYSNTGTLHVLAVSGMHVGLIFMILGWLLQFLDRTKRTLLIKHLLIIACLWLYSLLCGLSPSILRATVMFTFIITGKIVNRSSNVYNTLALSAFTLLCVDTNMIANTGFQLSYMAVIGIVFLQPYVYAWYTARSWAGDQVWKITSVSIAAQLTTFPLGLLYFHQFPNYFLFSNLIIIPLTTLIIYLGIVLIACAKIPFLAALLGKLMYWGIALTNAIVRYVEQMPFAYVNGIHISIVQTLLIFGALVCFTAFFLLRKTSLLLGALVMSCGFFAFRAVQRYENHVQQKMLCYHVSAHTALNILQAERSTLLIDSALWNDQGKVHFHLQQHFWHSGIAQQQRLFTDAVWKHISVDHAHFMLSGKGLPRLTMTGPYTLIIKDRLYPRQLQQLHPAQVIITGAVRPYAAATMKALFGSRNIPCRYVGDSGAFELSL